MASTNNCCGVYPLTMTTRTSLTVSQPFLDYSHFLQKNHVLIVCILKINIYFFFCSLIRFLRKSFWFFLIKVFHQKYSFWQHLILSWFFTIDFGNENNNGFKQSPALRSLVRMILNLGFKRLLKNYRFFLNWQMIVRYLNQMCENLNMFSLCCIRKVLIFKVVNFK